MRKRILAGVGALAIAAGGVTAGLLLTAGDGALTPAQQQAQLDRWMECHINPGGPLIQDPAMSREYRATVERVCMGSEGSLQPG
jgi:hypothetical protein